MLDHTFAVFFRVVEIGEGYLYQFWELIHPRLGHTGRITRNGSAYTSTWTSGEELEESSAWLIIEAIQRGGASLLHLLTSCYQWVRPVIGICIMFTPASHLLHTLPLAPHHVAR